jgi:hypothetical protein
MLLRNIMLASIAVVAAMCGSGDAAALTERDVLGVWCTDAGSTEFTRNHLNIFRLSDRANLQFRIKKYDFGADSVRVHWTKSDGTETYTTYWFDQDGRTMRQGETPTSSVRPHWRC